MTRRDVRDLLLLSAFWAMSFLLIKWAGHDFPPVWVALLRSVFGLLVLLLAMAPTQTSAVTCVLPIWGLFWGFLAREPVGLTSLLGVAVVLLGVMLLNAPPLRRVRA